MITPDQNDSPDDSQRPSARRELEREVSAREERKIKARQEQYRTAWFGLGMFGVVGWSVAVPPLLGVAIGLWIDARWPSRFSWTLMLLVLGVILGCLNAWRWISQESQEKEE
jgi:ATP synthase protein I